MTKNPQIGFSIVELCIVVVLIGIIAAIAIPNLYAARRSANEASAIASLRTVSSGQEVFQSTKGEGEFGDLSQLIAAGLLDSTFLDSKSGYTFQMNSVLRVNNNGMGIFNAVARPILFGGSLSGTGTRHFYTNEAGVIYQSDSEYLIPSPVSNANRLIQNGSAINY